jgi:predicted RNase H-related nuclease YkuK (DUF458 family)
MNWKNVSWFDGSGNPCSYEHIISSIITNKKDHEIHVGADSQPLKDATSFAVVICLYKPRCGAFYFVTRSKSSSVRFKNLGVRLQYESELAISLADLVRGDVNIDSITVHADISQNPINKSSKYSNRIQNFIKSMGFKCMIKPDSWAAWVADKHAK